MLADEIAMMSSEVQLHCNHFLYLSCLRDVFPQLPVQPSTECTRTDTPHSNPIQFLTERVIKYNHKPTAAPSIDRCSCRGRTTPFSPFDSLALVPLTPSLIGAVGPLPLPS